jgi:NAD(P)-dependent dehydrogenase (short-subunit alcohol dehydrogenase family)
MTTVFAGRHVVITGAGRGIGAALARRFAADGATLTLLGRSRAALDEVAASLERADVRVATCDVSDAQSVASTFAALSTVDILINNAGQAGSAPLHKITDEHWHTMLAVNLTGTFLCTRAVLPAMLSQQWGRIVNIASTAGLRGYEYTAAYTASKHGVIGLTRSLALETARKGITVNAVCPGFTDTPMLDASVENITALTPRTAEQTRELLAGTNPQHRFVQPAEVAHAVAWLCAPGSESITGQSISVSGGEVM